MDKKDIVEGLSLLGAEKTEYKTEVDPLILETFPNKFSDRGYHVVFETQEFTSLCPKTGQPDFARIVIDYIPSQNCIESKSLKLYLFSFRGTGSFMETIINTILEDLVKICSPCLMLVTGYFNARGGITTKVVAEYHE